MLHVWFQLVLIVFCSGSDPRLLITYPQIACQEFRIWILLLVGACEKKFNISLYVDKLKSSFLKFLSIVCNFRKFSHFLTFLKYVIDLVEKGEDPDLDPDVKIIISDPDP